jgi:hypothetical protein
MQGTPEVRRLTVDREVLATFGELGIARAPGRDEHPGEIGAGTETCTGTNYCSEGLCGTSTCGCTSGCTAACTVTQCLSCVPEGLS